MKNTALIECCLISPVSKVYMFISDPLIRIDQFASCVTFVVVAIASCWFTYVVLSITACKICLAV